MSCPIALRRARIDAAVRFLKRNCVLVEPVDRFAQIRRYRVSGKRDPMFAEQVIEMAEAMGMEALCDG